jgi:hypothetical protein
MESGLAAISVCDTNKFERLSGDRMAGTGIIQSQQRKYWSNTHYLDTPTL